MDQVLPDYYKVSEAADHLGIHPESVRRLYRQKKIAGIKVGNPLLFPRQPLETFAATYDNRPGNKRKVQ